MQKTALKNTKNDKKSVKTQLIPGKPKASCEALAKFSGSLAREKSQKSVGSAEL